ncbi:MAG: CRTAC1 family protein [Myxococcaceae bacterium]|nr:CRTAC1 family protein [Myxococcaceae bacterium]
MRQLPLALVLFASCLKPASESALVGTGAAITIDDKVAPLSEAPTCAAATPGTLFADTSESWRLDDQGLKVRGNRLTVADLDGDGYPDLVVHAVSSNVRQLQQPDGGARLVWQLMNRKGPDGLRHFVDETGNGLFQVRGGSDTHYRAAHLAVFGDVDNDGDLDAFSGTYDDPSKADITDRSELLLNDGTGRFTLAPPTPVRGGSAERLPTTSATFTDVDRDGRLDLFVGYFYEYYGRTYQGLQAQLLLGQGTGGFTSGTAGAALTTTRDGFEAYTNHRPAYGVTSCDLDDDGAPELLVSAYGRQRNLLYRNDGRGRFTDQSEASGFFGDGNVDFTDNENFKCWCTVNQQDPKCAGVGRPRIGCGANPGNLWGDGIDDQPWRSNGNTFTTWCGDLTGDGKLDLYSAEIRHFWAGSASDSSELLKNESQAGSGAVRFSRPGNQTTGMGLPRVGASWNEGGLMAAGGDLDNDGLQDLIVAASDYPDQVGVVLQQQSDGRFVDKADGFNLKHACMSGLAIADFDRDGDLDVIAGASTARDCSGIWKKGNEVRLYENQGPAGKSLLLRLKGNGTTTNRSAIGARVTVKAGGKTIVREVGGGYGHFGMQNDTVVHVGVGGCNGVDELTIRWPDAMGTTQRFERVPADGTLLEARQGEAMLYRVKLK